MSVFIVRRTENAPLEVQKVFKEIFKHAVVVALNGKHGEKNSVRIWARGVEGGKELSDDQKEMYLLSAYGRASDYDNDRTTFATFSGSWILDGWNGLQVIGRITPASSGGPVISYGVEEAPTLDISVPEDSQLPQFDVARAKLWEREQLIKEAHPFDVATRFAMAELPQIKVAREREQLIEAHPFDVATRFAMAEDRAAFANTKRQRDE